MTDLADAADVADDEATWEDDRDDPFLQQVARVSRVAPEQISRVPAPGALIGDRYILEREVGRGGMGVVYAATHRMTAKRVALKWTLPQSGRDAELTRRFLREARAAGAIDHPNVVSVYDAGTHAGGAFIVMELLRGESLRARLGRGPLPLGEALRIGGGVIAGVREAHAQGILHRDLKPDNVFLCAGRSGVTLPKVLDFGVSRMMNPGSELSGVTGPGAVVGTPGYMPLEQLQGHEVLDPRVDVYAIGVLLYEMLTGRRPHTARTYEELIVQVATVDPEPPQHHHKGVPPALGAVIMRAIAREPRARHKDLGELALAIHDACAGLSPARRHHRALAGGVWLLAALLLSGLGFLAWQRSGTGHPGPLPQSASVTGMPASLGARVSPPELAAPLPPVPAQAPDIEQEVASAPAVAPAAQPEAIEPQPAAAEAPERTPQRKTTSPRKRIRPQGAGRKAARAPERATPKATAGDLSTTLSREHFF